MDGRREFQITDRRMADPAIRGDAHVAAAQREVAAAALAAQECIGDGDLAGAADIHTELMGLAKAIREGELSDDAA